MLGFEMIAPPAKPTLFPLAADAATDGMPAPAPAAAETPVTADDIDMMVLYLAKARDRAAKIRDNAPAGSYLDSVLTRTISGLDREIAELRYLLARRDHPDPKMPAPKTSGRMRPAL